ncbi:MAG: Uncharacterised protein [Synechococcus sp. CC9902]|nr:MAG: Uncharacterised protein [Synechococcus sp. CC9902]
MHRKPDGSALICNRTGDGLTDPPRGVGGELVALFVIELLGCTNQTETALLNQVLKAQAPVHVLLGNRHHKTQVRLNHFFLGPSAQHQATSETDQGHLHKGGPFLVVRLTSVVTFELSRKLLEVQQVGDFACQLDFLIRPQQADATDLLQIHPNGIFGVDTLGPDLDARQSFRFGGLLSRNGLGFLLGRENDLRFGRSSLFFGCRFFGCRLLGGFGLGGCFFGRCLFGRRFLGSWFLLGSGFRFFGLIGSGQQFISCCTQILGIAATGAPTNLGFFGFRLGLHILDLTIGIRQKNDVRFGGFGGGWTHGQ